MNALFQTPPDGHSLPVTVLMEMFEQPIPFYPWAARIGGSAMAGLLLCYGIKKTQALLDDQGITNPAHLWFEAPVDDVQAQTGMTRFEQQSAKRCLTSAGYLESHHSGLPARKLYRLNLPSLMAELERRALKQGAQAA